MRGELILVYKRKMSKLLLSMLTVLLAISGWVKPMPVMAEAPKAIPSQIALSIAGGAEVGKSAIGINWVTDITVSDSEIIYGLSSDLADGIKRVANMSAPVATDIMPESRQSGFKAIHAFHVVIPDLTPGTKYYYKVGNTSNGYSEIGSFIAPADAADNKPFSFVVSPDTQGYSVSTYDNTAKLYDHIKENEQDAAFLIHMGDIVENGNVSDEWQYFFDAAQNLASTLPIMATPGNHDGASYDRDFIQYKSRFNHTSLRKPDGLSTAADGTVYSFEYGDALFVSLNSFASSADDKIQWSFLENEAATTSKKWKIAYLHVPPYDPGASHYRVDNVTGKKLTDAGIDLVLNGHEHAYARTTLKTTSDASGTGSIQSAKFGEAPTYVIGGSVYNYGYSLHGSSDTSWNDYFYDLRINKTGTGGGAIHAPGVYSKVEVTSNAIIYKAYYKATGTDNPFRVIDEFTIVKTDDGFSQPIGGGEIPTSVTFMLDNFNEETRQSEKDKYIARFNWVTPVTTKSSQLFYAKKSDFENNGGMFTDFALGTNFTVDLRNNIEQMNYTGAGTEYSVEPVQSHKAQTAVLEPGTEYVYAVGDGANNVTSVTTPASFTTPANNVDTFNFNWISDAQANDTRGYKETLDSYTKMSKKALTQAFADYPDAAFVVSSGDQVNFGFDTWEWDAFFEANQDLFSKVPLYMATGNHEFDGAGNKWANSSWDPVDPTLQNFLGRHNPPKNGVSFYGGGDGTERMVSGMTKLQMESSNYYFIYGDTLFLVMDYQDQSSKEQIKAQQDWMKAVVKQNPTKWRVGMFHKTLFGYRMPTPVASWTDAFDEAGLDVVLMGHDHIYARTKLFASGQVVADYGDGTTYLTNYSANKDNRGPLYKVDPGNPAIAYIDTREVGRGYANISISPDQIRVTSKGFDKNDELQTGDVDVLVTNKPRTYNLNNWSYPEVPEEVNEFTIKSVDVNGIAKEGQTMQAAITPASASVIFQWENSQDGVLWSAIDGASKANYTIAKEDVGSYLRVVATGTGFYNGKVTSAATGKITPLGGSGTAIVKIGTAGELAALAAGFGTTDYPIDGTYELSADIDMSGQPFQAIGGGGNPTPFLGSFNGKGYTINNLTIASNSNNTGFFGYIGSTGSVKNLKLVNLDISGASSTGAVAGVSTGTIENSYVEGKISGSGYTGGIVGLLHGGVLQNSYVSAEVIGRTGGGLIGGSNYNNSGSPLTAKDVQNGKVIENNYVSGTITGIEGTQYIGALIGDMGGGSGSLLQTMNGNIIVNAVTDDPIGKIAGYWSGSRPIIDSNQHNYYVSAKLDTSGLPSAIVPVFQPKEVDDFGNKQLYEDLGWDFASTWDWDAVQNVPVPKVITSGEEEDKFVTIIASASNGGTINPQGYVLVEREESQTFVFTPNHYFEIDTVKVDGVVQEAAALAGEYTFDNVADVHTIDVSFKLSDATSGIAPSVVSTSAYYNRAVEAHIWVTVDFGEGALGILPENWRKAVSSVKMMKDGELILDADGGYWFPSTGYGVPENILEICYDDINKFPGYDNLVPGTYDLVITFADLSASTYTIPLLVEERVVSTITVEGGQLLVDGEEVASPAQVKENATVSITTDVPSGQKFVKWTADGLAEGTFANSTITFAMPAHHVTLKAEFAAITSGGGNVPGYIPTPQPEEETEVIEGSTVTVTAKVEQTADGQIASAIVTEEAIEEAMKRAEAVQAGVAIKVDAPEHTSNIQITIPQTAMSSIVQENMISIELVTSIGTVILDAQALKAIADATREDGVTITIRSVDLKKLPVQTDLLQRVADRPVIDVNIVSDSKQISDLQDGKATIVIPYSLQSGEKAEAVVVYYLNDKGEMKLEWSQYNAVTGTNTVVVDHLSTFAVGYNYVSFIDVVSNAWYTNAVDFVTARQLFNGVNEQRFAPEKQMTRAMFAMVIANLENADLSPYTASSFIDVAADAWYSKAIAWAADNNIITGVGNQQFKPDAPITREQMAVMLSNYMEYKGITLESTSQPAFADASSISPWAKDAVTLMQRYGIINGVGANRFDPKADANRASVATIFANFIKISLQ